MKGYVPKSFELIHKMRAGSHSSLDAGIMALSSNHGGWKVMTSSFLIAFFYLDILHVYNSLSCGFEVSLQLK
jgi:hypothetical protein